MADVDVNLDEAAIKTLVFQPGVARYTLRQAKAIALMAQSIAPKRYPRHMYAASIVDALEVTGTGPVAYVSGDVDAVKIEFGTNDTPRFRPLGKAVEAARIA